MRFDAIYTGYLGTIEQIDQIKALFEAKGLTYEGNITDRREYREKQLDLLADTVRKSLDMELVYKIIREGI